MDLSYGCQCLLDPTNVKCSRWQPIVQDNPHFWAGDNGNCLGDSKRYLRYQLQIFVSLMQINWNDETQICTSFCHWYESSKASQILPMLNQVILDWQACKPDVSCGGEEVARYVLWKSLLTQWKIIYVQLCRKNVLVTNLARPRFQSYCRSGWSMLKATVETWCIFGEVKAQSGTVF